MLPTSGYCPRRLWKAGLRVRTRRCLGSPELSAFCGTSKAAIIKELACHTGSQFTLRQLQQHWHGKWPHMEYHLQAGEDELLLLRGGRTGQQSYQRLLHTLIALLHIAIVHHTLWLLCRCPSIGRPAAIFRVVRNCTWLSSSWQAASWQPILLKMQAVGPAATTCLASHLSRAAVHCIGAGGCSFWPRVLLTAAAVVLQWVPCLGSACYLTAVCAGLHMTGCSSCLLGTALQPCLLHVQHRSIDRCLCRAAHQRESLLGSLSLLVSVAHAHYAASGSLRCCSGLRLLRALQRCGSCCCSCWRRVGSVTQTVRRGCILQPQHAGIVFVQPCVAACSAACPMHKIVVRTW